MINVNQVSIEFENTFKNWDFTSSVELATFSKFSQGPTMTDLFDVFFIDSQMDASVTVEANDTNKAIYENTSNKSVMVGPWENLLKVANSTLLVKSRFLNVFSNSMLT